MLKQIQKKKIKKHIGSGYIQKQNEAVEICKQCKYRKQYIEQRNKANKYDSLVEEIKEKIEELNNLELKTIENKLQRDSAVNSLQELLDTEKEEKQ